MGLWGVGFWWGLGSERFIEGIDTSQRLNLGRYNCGRYNCISPGDAAGRRVQRKQRALRYNLPLGRAPLRERAHARARARERDC